MSLVSFISTYYTLSLEYSQLVEHIKKAAYAMIKAVMIMISYEPFYKTLKEKNITEYYLIYKQGMSANTLHRMKKGCPITTDTLNTLCFILDCEVSDIIRYDRSQ